MQGPGALNNILATTVVVFGTGAGVFVYSGTPALGNPPIAWMSQALVDPYGNVLPANMGLAATGTFQAGNIIINTTGFFMYSGTPAANNLVLTVVPGASPGHDSFGNQLFQGFSFYKNNSGGPTGVWQVTNIGAAGNTYAIFVSTNGQTPGPFTQYGVFTPTSSGLSIQSPGPIDMFPTGNLNVHAGLLDALAGLAVTGGSTTDTLTVTSTTSHGGKVTITAGGLAVTGGATIDTITSTGGTALTPTTILTDTPNTMSLLNSWTSTGRHGQYLLNPDGTVTLDFELNVGTATNGTAVWQAPTGYVPGVPVPGTQRFPMIVIAGATAAQLDTPQWLLTTTGALQCSFVPTGTTVAGGNIRYRIS